MNKIKVFFSIGLIFFISSAFCQKVFNTSANKLVIKVNNQIVSDWTISSSIKPDIFEAECVKKVNTITFSDEKDSISFTIGVGKTIDFIVLVNKKDSAYTRIIGTEPNVKFTKSYIQKHKGKVFVEIPEVSELVNILMALHQDAEKEDNMFDTKTAYYKKVKKYFAPYKNHPVMDTIHKYIGGIHNLKEQNLNVFSNESYGYYYALKMNACAYHFDKKCQIKNKGIIKQFAKGWYSFDPMKDLKLFEDFAKKSNFRDFYNENKPYYDSLIVTYNQLNPIQKMQTWLNKKFGFGYGSYMIYFSPLIYGAHSTQRFTANNFEQNYMFIARAEFQKEYSPVMNAIIEGRIVFTEIDHNYINPTTYKYLDKVNIAFSKREIWAKGDITSTYRNQYMTFNEYMTWAVYSLYVNDNYPKQELEEFLNKVEKQMEEKRGFIKFKNFNRVLLEKYQENPNVTITDLYEHILDWALIENSK